MNIETKLMHGRMLINGDLVDSEKAANCWRSR